MNLNKENNASELEADIDEVEYSAGELEVDVEESENKYVTSAYNREEKITSITIIAAILALAIITCTFFACFTEESVPVIGPMGSITSTTNPTTMPTTTPKLPDPDPEHPYATLTWKTQFVASEGGDNLDDVYLYSEYAILIRLSDMTTVAHQNADTVMYPASMTKVMTVVVALDIIKDLDDKYLVTREVLSTVPHEAKTASLGLFVGKEVTVRDLLYGITYISGADSVLCLLDYLGLTVDEFAEIMNEKAAAIGLENTTFGGAIGMDDEFNQTTCRDMAAIMAYAMENPLCRELFGKEGYRFDNADYSYNNATFVDVVRNKFNKNESTIVPGYTLIATKSGLEDEAGYCLVSLLKNNTTGEEFVLVTANAPYANQYNKAPIYDMIELFDELKP